MSITTTYATSSTSDVWDMPEPSLSNFEFLIPTVTAIALGILFVPHFGLGLIVGAACLAASTAVSKVLEKMGVIEEEQEANDKYSNIIKKNILRSALFSPIAEEAIYRGGILPSFTYVTQFIAPTDVALTVSIVASGILFGAHHYFNPHKDALSQSVSAGIIGIGYGFLAVQFGIGAAMAAHIANNTLVLISIAPSMGNQDPFRVKTEPYIKERCSALPA